MSQICDLGHSDLTVLAGAPAHILPPTIHDSFILRLPARNLRYEVPFDSLTPGQIYRRIKARLEAEGGVTWRSRFDPVREYYTGGLRTFNEAYHGSHLTPEQQAEIDKATREAEAATAAENRAAKGEHRTLAIAKNRAFREGLGLPPKPRKVRTSRRPVVVQ